MTKRQRETLRTIPAAPSYIREDHRGHLIVNYPRMRLTVTPRGHIANLQERTA